MTPAAEHESVIYVSNEEVQGILQSAAEDAGLTLDEFIEKGRADELEGEARDQWLMWGPINDPKRSNC